MKNRDKILKSFKYFKGIHYIKGTKLYTNIGYLGGYLGMARVNELKELINENIKILKVFKSAKESRFGVLKLTARSTYKVEQCF